jgi:hypothetical protein
MKNIIRKILKEEFNEFGFDTEIDPVMEFLYNKFMECKLEKVGSKNWVGWTKYVDKSGKILFLDNINTGDKNTVLYFDYHKINEKMEEMGLNHEEIKKLCVDVLYETHKRKVLTAEKIILKIFMELYETHKRKVLTAIPNLLYYRSMVV